MPFESGAGRVLRTGLQQRTGANRETARATFVTVGDEADKHDYRSHWRNLIPLTGDAKPGLTLIRDRPRR